MDIGRIEALALRPSLAAPPVRVDGVRAIAYQGLEGDVHADALSPRPLLLAGVAVEYEVDQILRGAAVRSTVLGPAPSGHLGWDAYLVTGPQPDDRDDVRYNLQPLEQPA
jgi:type VI secretion system protein ImpH